MTGPQRRSRVPIRPGTTGVDGVTSGDDVDFDGGGYVGDGVWEQVVEGGQSLIDGAAFPNAGATEDFDPTDGNVFARTLDANLTATILEPDGSGASTLEFWFVQDGGGGNVVTIAADGGTVFGDISAHTLVASEGFRVMADRIPGTSNDWLIDLVGASGSGGGEPTADAHIADTSDAHDASAVSVLDTGGYFTGTDVEAALAELAVLIAAAGTSTGGHAHVVSETHLSNGSTTTWTLDNYFEPGTVIAWNTTTLARLGVTEVAPDQATVSAAGTTGDSIVFDYATPLV